MNTNDLLKFGSTTLKDKKIVSFDLDAELLLAKVLRKNRQDLLQNLNQKINKNDLFKFSSLIYRRSSNEPIAYILKRKEFWSKFFHVTKDTLIPRPETELMVDQLIKMYKNKKNISVLDMGTGSGCIIISLLSELNNSFGVGIDISHKAIKVAIKNAKNHSIDTKEVSKDIDKSFIQFHFQMKGSSTFIFNQGNYKMNLSKEKYIVLYNPKKNLPVNLLLSQNSEIVSILISIKKFHKLFSEDAQNIHFLKDENANQKYYYENSITNPVFLTLNEIKRLDENSSTKNLYLKAKIYELFSHLYNRNRDQNIEQCPFLTNEENFKKIKMAKEIVIENMINPPSLVELSEQINS